MSVLHSVLFSALTVKRPHGGEGEARFVAQLANTFKPSMIDGAGNLHFDNRITKKGTSKTLFTAHTDTVHHEEGKNFFTESEGKTTILTANGAPLGADDGAGVALLMHMLDNDVPGYFILFRGEEVGGIGSRWLAENMPLLLGEFDRAIAFDRAGYGDVITHQAGGRCASDAFGQALADALNAADESFMFSPDPSGVYTDTAEFVDLIPECTNLSVGYFSQHTHNETQDVNFLEKLAEACLKVEWEKLPTERKVGTEEFDYLNGNTLENALSEAMESNPWDLLDILEIELNGLSLDPEDLEFPILHKAYQMAKRNDTFGAIDYLIEELYWKKVNRDYQPSETH